MPAVKTTDFGYQSAFHLPVIPVTMLLMLQQLKLLHQPEQTQFLLEVLMLKLN